MSRTKRICPRRYIKVADGKQWHKCKCEWCMNVAKKRKEERWQDKQIIGIQHNWLMHTADNCEIVGSNPTIPTKW